ncbi:Signal peptide peptidase [Chondromyces crocatus]|uniref:Signal peptide peptidase n=2 Tax=Chondromyces crocatus TaxID=52 RepID=A0A0K1E7M2_CHOCO|nr:Signal peptide peptidase [Chondromyces crocatus]
MVEIDLSRGLPESAPTSWLGTSKSRTHADLVRSLRGFAASDTTRGILVRLGMARLSFAGVQEVGRLLGAVRKAGKPVVCHADEYNNGTMLLAAAGCSKLWLSPAGQVDTVGIAAQLLFAKGLLDKLNISADYLQVGKFKGASEPFTRESASPEARASLQGALGGVRAAWIATIVEGRRSGDDKGLEAALENGPYSPAEAVELGLVDAIGDLGEARSDAEALAGVEQTVARFGGSGRDASVPRGLVDIYRSLSGASAVGEPHVTIVPAAGSIAMSSGASPLGGSDGIGERELGRVIARLANDKSTKAVVLRIDSPGGSALASDLLWKRLMKLREEKPLVVSIGGMAASGGYYLACAGTKILAEETSIIGSIGVVGGKLAVGHALASVGVHAETVAANPDPLRANRAAYMSMLTPWDDATRARVLTSIQSIYDLFLERIAAGRGVAVETISPSAEGRLFSGAQAKQRGLVDEMGGLDEAVRVALDLAKLPGGTPVEIERDDMSFLDMLAASDVDEDDSGDAHRGVDALQTHARRVVVDALASAWLVPLPELGTFVGSFAPLLSGERALAALPFAVVLR